MHSAALQMYCSPQNILGAKIAVHHAELLRLYWDLPDAKRFDCLPMCRGNDCLQAGSCCAFPGPVAGAHQHKQWRIRLLPSSKLPVEIATRFDILQRQPDSGIRETAL